MLDDKDRAILNELEKDSRRSTKSIAKDLNIPRATVHERIRRMMERGIIKGFTVVPDFGKLGEPVTAFILYRSYRTTTSPRGSWPTRSAVWTACMRCISSPVSMTSCSRCAGSPWSALATW